MITDAAYRKLEPKLQSGIYRYISEKTKGADAGDWLGTVFGIDALKGKNIASIAGDVSIWTGIIMQNESLRRVISISESTVEYFATNASDAYVDFITEVCTNTNATTKLFESLKLVNGLATFMNTETAVRIMAANENSMKAVVYMIDPFAAMISSETAMNIVAASEIAVNVIIEGFTNVANSETVLDSIKENLTDIEGKLPSIANSELNISEVADVKEHIADVILSLQKTTTQADILAANITAFITSEVAMTEIFRNKTATNSIIENNSVMNILYTSEVANEALSNSSVAIDLMTQKSLTVQMTDRTTSTWTTLYDGKAFVLGVKATWNQGCKVGEFVYGDAERPATNMDAYEPICGFVSQIKGYSYYSNKYIIVKYFPLQTV